MKAKAINNCRGQAVLEALVTLPALLAAIFGLIFLMWLGWLRFELGQMVQNLGACLDSTQQTSRCRASFESSIKKIPGRWRLQKFLDRPKATHVELVYEFGRRRLEWSIDEPKVFQLKR